MPRLCVSVSLCVVDIRCFNRKELTKVGYTQLLAIATADEDFAAVYWQLGDIQSRRRGEGNSAVVVSKVMS